MMSELKPCPFCGAQPTETAIEPHKHSFCGLPDHPGSHVIECGCGAALIDDTREKVVARWNTRSIDAARAELLAGVEVPEPVGCIRQHYVLALQEPAMSNVMLTGISMCAKPQNDDAVAVFTADQLRAAIAAARAAQQWRTIATAPKDGTMFLCWVSAERYSAKDGEGSGRTHDVSQVDFCLWRRGPVEMPDAGYFDPACGKIGDAQDVTHWMPLPPPPSADAIREGVKQ